MSYDCMPCMCLTVLYVLSCMFSVTILCLFDRRFKSSILCYLYCYVSSLNKAFELKENVHFKLIDDLFPDTDINEVHHHLLCINRNCTRFSKAEKNRQSHLKGKKNIIISNMNSQLS